MPSTPEQPNKQPEVPTQGSPEAQVAEKLTQAAPLSQLSQSERSSLLARNDSVPDSLKGVVITDKAKDTSTDSKSDNSANSLPITDSRVLAALDKDAQIAQIDTVEKAEAALAEQIKTIRGIENAVTGTQDKMTIADASNRAAVVKEMDDGLS